MNPMSYGLVGCLLTLGVVHAESSRPNILLITSEDNGPELGCYGDPYAKTPHLDALAREGIRFDRAFVTQAGCSQSRASILTGLYPHQNGQIGLATWKFRMYRDDTPNMVRSLKGVGYRTGIIGKVHVNPATAFPFDSKALPSSNFARKKLARYGEQASRFFHASDQPFFLMIHYPDDVPIETHMDSGLCSPVGIVLQRGCGRGASKCALPRSRRHEGLGQLPRRL